MTAPDVLRRRLFQPTTAAFAAVAVLVALLDVAGIAVPEPVQVVPFAVSVLLFGLPHGALDHLVPARLDPGISRRRSIASVVLLYAVLGAATAAVWIVLPVAGFTLFILVTWFHWGQGDLWLDRALGDAPPSRTDAALTVLVRGALPMLGPLLLHAREYAAVLRGTTGLLGARSAPAGALLESPVIRLTAALVLVALITAHLVVRRRAGGRPAPAVGEITVLAIFFLVVPPVLAVGLYFTFWHAVRHIVRLELLTDGGRAALQRGHLLRSFGRFLRDAAPLTACAVVLLAALALVLRSADLGTYLLLIAALTTPHTAVVTWMDRRRSQGVAAVRGEEPVQR
ncbi:Brp/Blh family beta-carotene 15,15'-dioxygenase [Amnibacterium kyonggiense]|nr:Brp/Blh family beta-carotene 15,15'-dioxygenase [Amnibacterium kyonggiense]